MDSNTIETLFHEAAKLTERFSESIACHHIMRMLRPVLREPATASAIPTDKNRIVLFEKIGGLTILGHHHPESVWSPPHDHGRSWAIYGVVTGKTAMYDYELIADKNVRLTRSYWILPGQCFYFPTGFIHSHKTYDDSRLIRIEGMNLWRKENKIGGNRYTWIK